MKRSNTRLDTYTQLVEKKFRVYTALFLNLPFEQVANTGMYLPLLARACERGLEEGLEPVQIIDRFFETNTDIRDEDKRRDFLFRIIQYVERQVVLFDAIEDASFKPIAEKGQNRSIRELVKSYRQTDQIDQLYDKLNAFSVRLVFTAHPTQFYPGEVLGIIQRMRDYVRANDINGIDRSLQQLGLTSFIKRDKPTPYEEALNIIYYLRYVFYPAIGEFYNGLRSDLKGNFDLDNPELIRVGFWPGGDRDGNPFVNADITQQVADELRLTLMKCYYHDVKDLQQKLTFRGIQEILGELRDKLYNAMFDPSRYMSYKYILERLSDVRDILVREFNSLYLQDLDDFIAKVRIFKSHFATLDIRQDHSVHREVVFKILKTFGWDDASLQSMGVDDLLGLIEHPPGALNAESFEDPVVRDTIENISRLGVIQRKNGERGCNRYIISNSEDVFAVLYVYALFRWCGWKEADITFHIIPLFETMEGMNAAEEVMRKLFSIRQYRAHVSRRQNRQTIMLGFSDGTKDGGYLRANWAIFRTKEVLSRVCEEHGIEVVFFDGRGGPPARGGGKTHRFYASLGNNIANNEIQLTIQGQTITSTYGTKDQFSYNCEQMLTAGLINDLATEEQSVITLQARHLIDELANLSFEYYEKLKNDELFIPYLEEMSTMRYYSKANIGSRPGKRGRTEQLTLDDLRAISFVGAWSQLKQNVPGYYGLGYALEQVKKTGRIREVKRLFREVPFFKAVILNSMMSMCKSNFALTGYMKKHPKYAPFWERLHEEYERSKRLVLEISGYDELMEEEPISRNSIRIRESIVLPLLTIQQYALQKIAVGAEHSETYEKMVIRSLYGNINASRNSA